MGDISSVVLVIFFFIFFFFFFQAEDGIRDYKVTGVQTCALPIYYYLNSKNSIFGRYSYAAYTEQAPGAFGLLAGGPNFGNYAGSSNALNQSLAVGWTDTISPTLVNEFRLGYMRYHVFDVPNGYGTSPASDAGIPNLNLDKTYTSGMPYFDIQNSGVSDAKLGYS